MAVMGNIPSRAAAALGEVVETSAPASSPARRAKAAETWPDSHGMTSAQGFSSPGICSSLVPGLGEQSTRCRWHSRGDVPVPAPTAAASGKGMQEPAG